MEGVEQLAGRGVEGGELGEDLRGGLDGIDLFGDAGELGLVFAQVGVGDFEQVVERDVDHLVVEELLAEGVGAELVVAVGAREQVGLHPGGVVLERGDDGCVGSCEVGLGGGVGGRGEGGGNVVLKEADVAVDLFEGDLGEDARRIFEVLVGFGEDLRHQALARDDGAQAGVGGGVVALHDGEGRAGDAGGVVVGVLLPIADDLEREELRFDVVGQDGEIGGVGCVERGGIDGGELFVVLVQHGNLRGDRGGGVVFEVGVVLVQAERGGGGRVGFEPIVEVLVGEEVKGLRGAVGGEMLGGCGGGDGCEKEREEEGSHERQCNGIGRIGSARLARCGAAG